jgi:hypothetical protein
MFKFSLVIPYLNNRNMFKIPASILAGVPVVVIRLTIKSVVGKTKALLLTFTTSSLTILVKLPELINPTCQPELSHSKYKDVLSESLK